MSERSNTTPDQPAKKPGGATGKGFVKGDPRINRKGRPKAFDFLRDLAQKIGKEMVTNPKTGKQASRAEVILRQMAADPRQRREFLEIAYGKVPNPVEVIGPDGEESANASLARIADAMEARDTAE